MLVRLIENKNFILLVYLQVTEPTIFKLFGKENYKQNPEKVAEIRLGMARDGIVEHY